MAWWANPWLLESRRKTTIRRMVRALFTYGSLQVPAVMNAVTGRRLAHEPALLEGYARCRLRQRRYPGLRCLAGARTEGTLYHGVDGLVLSRLDRFEDDFYRRQLVRVVVVEPNRVLLAQAYVIPPQHYRLLAPGSWSLRQFQCRVLKSYLRRCRRRGGRVG